VETLLSPGDNLRAESLGQSVRIEEFLAEGTQGEIYRAEMSGREVAVKWYKPEWIKIDPQLLDRLKRTSSREPPNPRFLWPEAIVAHAEKSGFGYVMPYREPRFRDFDYVISEELKVSLRTLANAFLQTAEDYELLHAPGLSYVDVSAGNISLDPATGEVRICDCDNVDVNGTGMYSVISGTDGFMAPEIVQVLDYPNRQSDLWSLAVLIFWAFVKNHPLLGRREYDCLVFSPKDQLRLLGPEALFIFDPTDPSNRPVPGYNKGALLYWPIYPEFMRELFVRAFTSGIRNPQGGRVYEGEWRDAMAQLRDSIATCPHCDAENFCDGDTPHQCWRCQKELAPPRRIVLSGASVVMEDGAALYPYHVDPARHPDSSAPVARVVRHPQRRDLLGLENRMQAPWRVILPDQKELTVPPGGCVGLNPRVQIAFGANMAEIV
jgi:eukaryotic-like serine/threonine-protein kinase